MAQCCPGDAPEAAPARTLPLLDRLRPGRQGLTCRYKCSDACAAPEPNTSSNTYFGDVMQTVLDRRGMLRAGAVIGLTTGAGVALAGTAGAATPASPAPSHPLGADVAATGGGDGWPKGLHYETVPTNLDDAIRVPEGYESNVVIRWGDPITPDGPEFDFENQTAAAQAQQFGYNNDFCGIVPLDGSGHRFVMFSNHEYTLEPLMFRGYDDENPTEEQIRIGIAAHGGAVIEVTRDPKTGELHHDRAGKLNRRITADSDYVVSGPAAGSDLLRTKADPTGRLVKGTVNNCAGGTTPWGTFLSGEENFNGYFAAGAVDERMKRYGIEEGPSERQWEKVDPRWDLAQEPNEANRFGYIVEIDPMDPTSKPVKHTALGRFKHEGATIQLTKDGRPVAYMGDDERFDYVYKFVSDKKMRKGSSRAAREHNATLLDSGTLYVAVFTGNSPAAEITGTGALPADGRFDGGGEWKPLASTTESFVPGMSVEEVFVFTRLAADQVGATKMDRPEDVEPNPRTGKVYIACTNNSDRGKAGSKAGADEANPRNSNQHGHVIELAETRNDPTATTFGWNILLVCGDPEDPSTYFGGFDKSQVSPITSPDNVAFDPYGNLWVSTDSTLALEINDGLYGVVLEGPQRGSTRLFASVPIGSECCGPVVTEDFVLVSVQHPGDVDDASPEAPASHWPDGGTAQPRPAVAAIRHIRDGRPAKIGT
ncbi:PhoX family phosphatase [Pseudonocardia nematodicida]|uniref:PhoX family phosphatase n=1 Tax=Pseudonocardia nematodicida TaxID=1206997 RepID=A0ABV1KB37_9PSEU